MKGCGCQRWLLQMADVKVKMKGRKQVTEKILWKEIPPHSSHP